jgi:predicted dehydrogenase
MLSKSHPYGVLLVTGARTHQENYATLFANDPRCRLIAVSDESDVPTERLRLNRQFAEELKIPYIDDLNEALSLADVDVVSVCSEHERRGRVAVRCIQAGKHVYLDKPMTCNLKDADAVVKAVEEAGVYSQVFSFIHTPWAQTAKEAMIKSALGELLAIHCDVMFAKGYASDRVPKSVPRKESPYPEQFTFVDSKRELSTTGVYAIDLIRWITESEISKVFCVTGNYFFEEHKRNNVEDFGTVSLTLEDDIIATVACGRIGWTSHPAGGRIRLLMLGTEGWLSVGPNNPRLEVYADEPPWTPPPINPDDPMSFWRSTQRESGAPSKSTWVSLHRSGHSSNDASKFIDCIDAGKESEMSAHDGAAAVEALMAGYLSASIDDVVSLPLPR